MSRWSAPAPPACSRRSPPPRAGARVTLVSARPLAETASYWAQGGLAAALAPRRLARAAPRGHRDRRAAGRCGARPRRCCARRRRRASPTWSARRALRRRPPRRARARPGGRPRRPAGRARRRQRDRAPDPAPALRRRASSRSASRCWRARRVRALLRARRRRASARSPATTAASSRRRAVILATGGAAALWSRTTNPPGSYGSGLLLAHAAGAELADLEFVQFHPTAVVGIPGREGFLDHRGGPRRGRDAARRRRRALRRRAGSRATTSRARSSACWRETGAPAVLLDMPAIDPARFPNVVAALREAGPRPGARADPGLARRPLHDGRHRDRPRRPLDGRRACTRSASAPAPACTAPTGWPRTRSPSASSSATGRRWPRSTSPRRRRAPSAGRRRGPRAAAARATRAAMWRHAGLERDADGPAPAARRPAPAGAAGRGLGARARGEPRRPRARGPPRVRPGLDDHHSVVPAGAATPAPVEWT